MTKHPVDAKRTSQAPRSFQAAARFGLIGLSLAGGWALAAFSASGELSVDPDSASAVLAAHDFKGQLGAAMPAAELDVVHPQAGGLPLEIVQTGSIEAFESADLHARVSGYLRTLAVDIGDLVHEGQVLAEIDAPELIKEVERRAALVEQAKSRVLQAQARWKGAQARRQAAQATVEQSEADIDRQAGERSFREQEHQRISQLAARNAVEGKLVDEKRRLLEAALAGEQYARASCRAACAELAAVEAQIEQAQADLAAAQADVRVASADLDRARIMAGFTRIVAPFAGVVTRRSFDRGAFIRSADDGGATPLLSLARTDRVRVVVQIPDPDVPHVRPGNKATVRIDTLGGRTFSGAVARVSQHQDRRTRTMRAEIDLENPEGRLGEGMYGAVTIYSPAGSDKLTVPQSCLVGRPHNGKGAVLVVRDGRVRRAQVGLGRSNGERVELLSGLGPDDPIVVNAPEQLAGAY